jgi:hypothetical protein
VSLAIPFPDDLLDELADLLEERLQERRRWATVEQTAEYLGITKRQLENFDKTRGLQAAAVEGRPKIYDLRKVDELMEGHRG